MQGLTLEFMHEADVQAAAQEIWEKLKITGELHLHQTSAGVWRLEIQSERPVRAQTLARLGGKLIQVGGKAVESATADPMDTVDGVAVESEQLSITDAFAVDEA